MTYKNLNFDHWELSKYLIINSWDFPACILKRMLHNLLKESISFSNKKSNKFHVCNNYNWMASCNDMRMEDKKRGFLLTNCRSVNGMWYHFGYFLEGSWWTRYSYFSTKNSITTEKYTGKTKFLQNYKRYRIYSYLFLISGKKRWAIYASHM